MRHATETRRARISIPLSAALVAAIVLAALPVQSVWAKAHLDEAGLAEVHHRTLDIDGVNIFYREAGDPSRPTVMRRVFDPLITLTRTD